ncbi:MAG: L,D-transpeptidase family protein [Sporocytophaga sp.]|uniref:L,D-transpeptidase family protein n=1 Tax=Sporocytophaga sp. TaxID=2231183 RepID=UPI001B09CEB8|nr:L,D-transpeptidase family protein [Sporocytophaga sp.]MBO9699112.1 L,D-transpeptidase family protein [Sporocytophaga sp.]
MILFSCKGKVNSQKKVHSVKLPGIEKTDENLINLYFHNQPEDSIWKEDVHAFYKKRNYKLAWSYKGKFIPQANYVINMIKHIDEEGFSMECFPTNDIWHHYIQLSDYQKSIQPEHIKAREEFDIFLSITFFKYARKIWAGINNPEKYDWFISKKTINERELLSSVLKADLDSNFSASKFHPLHKQYNLLKKTLIEYRKIARQGGWGNIAKSTYNIKPGDTSEIIKQLRYRLSFENKTLKVDTSSYFDSTLLKALKKFQFCHGLDTTGILDPFTTDELNIPVEKRILQISANMERWRWLPEKGGDLYLAINIPEYALHVYEDNKHVWQMNVIVGKTLSHTPIFSNEIQFLVFNPSWNVPKSIAIKELLPMQKKDPAYLSSHHMQIFLGNKLNNPVHPDSIVWHSINEQNFNLTFIQTPGPENPLGKVKFLFPNTFDVYLHDTPSKYLFTQKERGFSHGCIRLEEPMKLAQYLLEQQGMWKEKEINKLLGKEKEVFMKLKKKVPVYIVYFTTWMDGKENVHFRKDIYGLDKKLIDELNF